MEKQKEIDCGILFDNFMSCIHMEGNNSLHKIQAKSKPIKF